LELDALGRPFAHVGITGYPESHPEISDDVTVQAMWDKRHYGLHSEQPLLRRGDGAALDQARARARRSAAHLFRARRTGGPHEAVEPRHQDRVGESARFLSGHAGWFLRMGAPGGYNPSRLLDRTGGALVDPASIVAGVHLFTSNRIRQTEQWRRSVLA